VLASLALVATLVFIAVSFFVGIRLLAIAARTRGLPELTLGLALFLIVGVGYPVSLAARALLLGESPGIAGRVLLPLASVLMNVGWAAVWVFTWRVFRPEATWARLLASAAIALLLLLAGASVSRAVAEPKAARLLAPTLTGNATLLLAQACYMWTAFESLRYWTLLRRRLALGLADPVVANRFLLWGVVAVLSALSLAGPTFASLVGAPPDTPFFRLTSAVAGLGCSTALALAFLPPRAYLRWVRGDADARA